MVLFYPTLSYLSILYFILSYNYFEVILLKPLKEKVSLTIDSDILEVLRTLAEDDDRSLSQYINIVLKSHISNKKQNSYPANITNKQ